MWEAAERGPLNKSVSDIASGEKARKMAFCIAEGIKVLDQRFLESATVLSLHRDGTDAVLLARFIAAGPSLEVRSGIFGVKKNFGSSAKEISLATEGMYQDIGKRMVGAPRKNMRHSAPVGEIVPKLAAHCKSITRLLNVDAAADELLSTEQMRGLTGEPQLAITPNVEATIRDRAHASRRVLAKPMEADEVLKELWTFYISDYHALVRRIENSHLHKTTFAKHCAHLDEGISSNIRNFRAAQHRFESWARPLGRFTLMRNALIATADEIATARAGCSEGTDAEQFKQRIDEKSCLLLAMMADFSDEALVLTRKADTESIDAAVAPTDVREFVQKIRCLFDHGACFITPSFTRYAVELLKSPVAIYCRDGATRVLGGVGTLTERVKQECLQRMRGAVALAVRVVETEWPSYDLLASFQVFDLARRQVKSSDDDTDDCQLDVRDVQRLAKAFKVDETALSLQLERVRAYAQRAYAAKHCENKEAWADAIRRFQQRHAADSRESLAVLTEVARGLGNCGMEGMLIPGGEWFGARLSGREGGGC